MQKRIPAVLMRGGTSKGLFFHDNHLPSDIDARNRVILAAFGSPDPNRRQIDGVGGGVSTTSKVAIISPSESPDYDVVYNFGQVSIDRPIVDWKGNCGNISSAVGPFAVDEGLVKAVAPVTRVRIHQLNTNKLITADVPVKNGRFDEQGDYAIAGVPGTHARVALGFADPGGALTGKLFPTGNRRDTIEMPDHGPIKITIVDAANPDFDRFPKFREALASALTYELEPGDAIFIPGMWWHQVQSLESFNLLVNYWWCPTPAVMGSPMTALMHGILSIRELPERYRVAWRDLFDYYVFAADESVYEHIPEPGRGCLAPLDEKSAARLRAFLANRFKP